LDQLCPEQENLFYRLLVVVDDYGCSDARPVIVLARCYPLRIGRIQPDEMASWLQNLANVGLITLYQVEGKEYLQVTKWEQHQHIRTKRHRYPLPVADGNKSQDVAATLDNLLQSVTICNKLQQVATSCNNLRELQPESLSLSLSESNPNPILTDSLPKHKSMTQKT
jgi:hypothetical protein